MKALPVALVFALALPTLTAGASAQALTGDACALLTPAEAGQALGAAVAAGQHVGTSTISCIYSPSGKTGPSARLVIVTLTPVEYFDAGNRSLGSMTAKPAAGLGTGAYFLKNRIGTNVHVKKGSRAFELRLQPGAGGAETQPQIEQKETALAQKALERL